MTRVFLDYESAKREAAKLTQFRGVEVQDALWLAEGHYLVAVPQGGGYIYLSLDGNLRPLVL